MLGPTGLGVSFSLSDLWRRDMARITVVNDNPEFLELVREILEDDRYEPTTIDGDRPDAVERIVASTPDLLMIDLRMGREELHGWDVAQAVRGDPRFDQLPILICSADMIALQEMESDLAGHHRVRSLSKPFGIEELTEAIEALLAEPIRP